MCYLVSVGHKSVAFQLTRSNCEGLYEVHWMELILICCGMAVKTKGLLRVTLFGG